MSWDQCNELAVNHFLRRFRCKMDPNMFLADLDGLDAVARTRVRTFHEALLPLGLPFRVNIRGIAVINKGEEENVEWNWNYGIAVPPITVNPLQIHNTATYPQLMHLLRGQFEYIKQELHDTPSGWSWVGLRELEFTYVAHNNLAAFLPHLPPLQGGCKKELPKDLRDKKCVINIQNTDQQCLKCCMICWDLEIYKEDNHERWGKYLDNFTMGRKPAGWKPVYRQCGLDLSTLPTNRGSDLDDITVLEQANPGLGVYVYKWHDVVVENVAQSFPIIMRMPPQPAQVARPVFLLLHSGHWCLIVDFQRFASQQHFAVSRFAGTSHDASHACHRCLENFAMEENLQKHLTKCKGVWENSQLPARLPSERIKGDKLRVYFTDEHKSFMHPITVYADIETFYRTENFDLSQNTKGYGANRSIASIGFHAVGCQGLPIPEEFQAQIIINEGVGDPFIEFMRRLLRLCLYWRFVRRNQEKISMTPQTWRAFNKAEACEHCGTPFGPKVAKCRDHDHLTGAYRAALCSGCNAKAYQPNVLKVLTHNGTGYDHHFYILGLARLQKYVTETLREFTQVPEEWLSSEESVPNFQQWKVDTLAESSEKLRCINFGSHRIQISFMDSLKFIKESVANMIESQCKAFKHDLSSGFPNMMMHHPMINKFAGSGALPFLKMLLQKIPYPYRCMDHFSFWDNPIPLDKGAYFDDLKQKPISDERLAELQTIVEKLGITTCRELHDTYLHTDVLALADCFEAFRKAFHATSGLDPLHYLGLPGVAWQALLKGSGAVIDNITQECCNNGGVELMKHVDANIRGGLSCAFVSHSKACNPNCPDHVCCKNCQHTWIKDFDANSLYPFCMSMPLPVGDYNLMGGMDAGHDAEMALGFLHVLLDQYTPESATGYMLVVRMEIPEDKHDYWDYAPAVNRPVNWEELSKRQQQTKRRKYLRGYPDAQSRARALARMMRNPGGYKLVPDLNPQDRKAIHVEHAQFLRKHGAVFTALYACYSFDQDVVFKGEIEQCASKRALSRDEMVRDMLKLRMNAPYGKTLENKRDRKNLKIHTTPASFQRNACYKRTNEFRIQHYCEDDGTFLGITTSSREKQTVLDTPRMVGWAILEYAKLVMMRFHYEVMKPMFGDNLKLLYTDTDSMYYEIAWPTDPIDLIAERNQALQVFDLSQVFRYKDTPLKNKLGCFKYEGAGNKEGLEGADNEIVEAVFLAPKSYAKKMAKGKLKVAGKGVPTNVLKEHFTSIEAYKEVALSNKEVRADFRAFRSVDHVVRHCDVSKVALSADNDKVFQVSPYCSRPLGHFRNKEPQPASPEWALEDSDDEAVPLAQQMIARGLVPIEPPAIANDIAEVSDAESED